MIVYTASVSADALSKQAHFRKTNACDKDNKKVNGIANAILSSHVFFMTEYQAVIKIAS